MGNPIDFSALSDDRAGALRRRWRLNGPIAVWPVWLGVAAIFVLPLVLWLGAFAVLPDPLTGVALLAIGFVPLCVVVIAVLVWWYLRQGSRVDSIEERLPEFAAANGLLFSPYDPDPQYPGALFSTGSQRAAVNHIRTPPGSAEYFDIGSFSYSVPAGRSESEFSSGFVAVRLDSRLPHMLLKARANDGASAALPIGIDRRQSLSLEGDFDRFFTLYCPADYETDALYVFAPDLMALLIDEAASFDVEIVDEWLFVYSPVDFSGATRATWERLFRIVDVLGAKTLRQTSRYSDDRMPPGPQAVGRRGRRLRGRASSYARTTVIVTVIGLLVAAGYVWAAVLTGTAQSTGF
jgi:hypothetical protein